MENKALKAVGYVRVSGQGQTDGHGWERQEEEIRAFAARSGIDVSAIYQEAHTGTEADRPAYEDMIASCMETGTKTIIVERLDRLARDLLIQCQLIAHLSKSGFTLLAADTGDNITEAVQGDPMRKALIGVQGIFAELDKNMLVRKLRKAREAKRHKGIRCEGKKPYGEHPGYPEEGERLQRILDLSSSGMSATEIAGTLNQDGVRTRKGSLWNPGTVFKILRRAQVLETA